VTQSGKKALDASKFNLTHDEADAHAVARLRDLAFEAVLGLWRQRKAEGMSQKDLAAALGRDQGWVSKALRGPGNWEFRTFGRMVRALRGEAEIIIHDLTDATKRVQNYDAYVVQEEKGSSLIKYSVNSNTNSSRATVVTITKGML